MSRRVQNNNKGKHVKVEIIAASCHVCKAHDKPVHVIESHNFRDVKGRVCCPTMLENVCSKCGLKGHFQSRCEVSTVFKPFKSLSTKYNAKKENKEKPKVVPVNAFAALAEESSDEEEEAIKNDPPPANVTLRKPDPKKAWADYESDDEW
jgi:hypothetical protein